MISKEDYAAGQTPTAINYNQAVKNANDAGGFRDTINAAETISAFRPVFLDDTTNTWKYADANDTARLLFDGISLAAGSVGVPMAVQCAGIVRGLSGLDAGKKYYVQDDGTIGTTPGAYIILVGKAISSTELLILKEPRYEIITGSNLIGSGGGVANSTSPTMVAEFIFKEKSGTIKTTIDILNYSGHIDAQVYKNNSPFGTLRNRDYAGSQSWNEDLSFATGDLIQLYVWRDAGGSGNASLTLACAKQLLPEECTQTL
jgi:hypothetical protein